MFRTKVAKNFIALFIISFFSVASQSFSQSNNKHDEPISQEHYEILKKRKDLILQDVTYAKNEWSGIYAAGDHHPTIFMWSVNQGFLAWGGHHTFFPSRINFGNVEFSNKRLIIKPEVSKEHLNFQYIPTELVPVKWDEQRFLIAADELVNFAYAVHSRAESQIVQYFVKSDDSEKPRTGLPNLPKEFEKILTMPAIKAKIIAVKNSAGNGFWDTELTLNRGRSDKVIKGMIFYYANSSRSIRLMISDVEEKTAKATIIGIGGSDETTNPKIGLVFSSKIPKNSPDF
jgi:hypothetical protein